MNDTPHDHDHEHDHVHERTGHERAGHDHAEEPPLDGRLFGDGQPCFGCGPDHPAGFRLRFTREDEWIVTRFTPGERYQGPPGIMHGGLVTTLADEVGAWTLVGRLGKFGFTAKIACTLHRPVRIGAEVVARGRVVKDLRRVVDVEVAIDQGGTRCVDGALRFVVLDRAGAERLLEAPLPEAWRRFGR